MLPFTLIQFPISRRKKILNSFLKYVFLYIITNKRNNAMEIEDNIRLGAFMVTV